MKHVKDHNDRTMKTFIIEPPCGSYMRVTNSVEVFLNLRKHGLDVAKLIREGEAKAYFFEDVYTITWAPSESLEPIMGKVKVGRA
jgi:hypothetical protein